MKIAIAQLNVTVGDLDGNAEKISEAARRARSGGAGLLLTTELALSGYPPEDLLLRDDFFRACDRVFQRLVRELSGITVVLGHPHQIGGKRYNAASVIRDGKVGNEGRVKKGNPSAGPQSYFCCSPRTHTFKSDVTVSAFMASGTDIGGRESRGRKTRGPLHEVGWTRWP